MRGSILLLPRHPSVFARMARWQLFFTAKYGCVNKDMTHDRVLNVIYLHTEIPCQLYLTQLKQYPKKEDKRFVDTTTTY